MTSTDARDTMAYVKLFGSILQSTVWEEDPETRVVWITMLALADQHGYVASSVPGLARAALVSRAATDRALKKFLSPDRDSRTKDADGRRIEVADGGWTIINHAKYRAMDSLEDRRRKDAERKRRWRAAQATASRDSHESPTIRSGSDQITTDQAEQSAPVQPPIRTPDPDGKVWDAGRWLRKYGVAWTRKYGTAAYGMQGDSKAASGLRDVLDAMPEGERIAAQAIAAQMFDEFLARGGNASERRHPFAFFVQEWGGLRVPKPNGEVARQRENDDKRLERETLARLRAEGAAAGGVR